MQDDVFDGQARDPSLVFVANQYLIEAERTYTRHFHSSSAFWNLFRQCFETTTRAIVEVDALQRSHRGAPRDLLAGYARVDSIFRIAVSAVCMKHRRARDMGTLGAFIRQVGIGSQILDDLEDVAEDLRRGRFNYVARVALANRSNVNPGDNEATLRVITREIVLGQGAATVLAEARRHFERAAQLLRPLSCRPMERSVEKSLQAVDTLAQAFHRKQVEAILGPILRLPKLAARVARATADDP